MEHVININGPRKWMSYLLGVVAIGLAAGCDSSGLVDEVDLSMLSPEKMVESITITPLFESGSDEPTEYLLRAKVHENLPGVTYPDGINLLGYSGLDGTVQVVDTGLDGDLEAGDFVYSARVAESCVPLDPEMLKAAAKGPEWTFSLGCDFRIVSPGEMCLDRGMCPETAERSFLWGLIEYETEVTICWCFGDCNIEAEVKVGG